MEKKLYDLTIDPELQKVAPPLTSYELDLLTADLIEHGCKFPIITWNGVIVDGHNRYKICHENNIPFSTEDIDFEDIMAAKLWIVKNQLGRRNLHEFQRLRMVLPFETELAEAVQKARRERISAARRGEIPSTLTGSGEETRTILAKMAGVSVGTLHKAKVILENADVELLSQLDSGQIKIHTAYKQVIEEIKKPTRKPLSDTSPQEVIAPSDGEMEKESDHVTDIPTIKPDTSVHHEERNYLEVPEEHQHPAKPIPFDVRTPEGEVAYPFGKKPEVVKPYDFKVIEAQFEDIFDYFTVNVRASLEWISKENATPENQKTIESMFHDLCGEVNDEIRTYFEKMQEESK